MHKRLKRGLALIPVAFLVLGIAACGGNNSGNAKEGKTQAADTTNLENHQPLPSVFYSQERQNLIDIELAEVNDVQTTTFVMHNGDQDPIFSGPSIGFGIPDSASLSNPLAPYTGSVNTGPDRPVVGQMDPNGIYAPVSSEGTFVIFLTSTGQPYINRIEDLTDTAGGPAEWDYTHHRWVVIGAPTALGTISPGHAHR